MRAAFKNPGQIQREKERLDAMWRFEREARESGFRIIAGIDEAGRGPLAGPVVSAAVILPEQYRLFGLDDSKKLSERQRENCYERITQDAVAWGVGLCDHEEIDRINILNATIKSMETAISELEARPDCLLIDAVRLKNVDIEQMPIVKGDALSLSIAAASVLAKVTRDRLMLAYDSQYPGYGFAKHKGYGTKEHIAKIKELGLCPIHRASFCVSFI